MVCSTYYVPGFNTDGASCALKDCGKPPPPGVLFANETECNTTVCTNAPAGWYYTQVEVERMEYLDTLECPVARCSPPKPDRHFVPGFATDHDACPTQPCNMSALPKGYYFQVTDAYTKCTPTPCEAVAGYFYLHGAEGGQAGCAKVRSKCTNAKLGEEYANQMALVLSETGCPVKTCTSLAEGKRFGVRGSCKDEDLVSCTNAIVGEYYVSSSVAQPCQVAQCDNAHNGWYYTAGNDKDNGEDWQTSPSCPLSLCTLIQGYTFKEPGKCSGMIPCDSAPAGYYYKNSVNKVCQHGKCTGTRGQWKYIPGFALREDKCAREKCPSEPPYVSLDSCEATTTTTPTTTNPAPLVAKAEVAISSGGEAMPTVTIIVIVAAASGSILVVTALSIIFCALKKRGKAALIPSNKPVVYAGANNDDGGYLDGTADCDMGNLDMQENNTACNVAIKAAGLMEGNDLLLNPDDVTLGRKLAQGAGGQIFMGTFVDQDVALKESYDMLMNDVNGELIKEANMMTKLTHHNIVRFFGIWQPEGGADDGDRVFLVMELCPNGDLRDAANDPDSTLEERQRWIVQVASAMSYLHGRTPPIVHRDLKPQNVLLDAHRNAKVCDFGVSKSVEKSRDMTVRIGTVAYMPPEMMRAFSDSSPKMQLDGTKCDVFSFAMLALYVATGKTPYEGLSNEQIFLKTGMNGGRTVIPSGYAGISVETNQEDTIKIGYQQFIKLVKQMWHETPGDRPGFDVVIEELDKVFKKRQKTMHI